MSKYESQDRYDKENTFRMTIKLNRKTEQDIIQKLESVDKKQTYIKQLIRADIRK